MAPDIHGFDPFPGHYPGNTHFPGDITQYTFTDGQQLPVWFDLANKNANVPTVYKSD